MRLPGSICPISGDACYRAIDCSDCSVITDHYNWVCSFCALCSRDVRRWAETKPDIIVGGLYSSGICDRCHNYRICLMAVLPYQSLPVGE